MPSSKIRSASLSRRRRSLSVLLKRVLTLLKTISCGQIRSAVNKRKKLATRALRIFICLIQFFQFDAACLADQQKREDGSHALDHIDHRLRLQYPLCASGDMRRILRIIVSKKAGPYSTYARIESEFPRFDAVPETCPHSAVLPANCFPI